MPPTPTLQSGVRLLVDPQPTPTYQLPRNDGGLSGLENFPAGLEGAPHPGPLGQHDSCSLYQSPRWCQVMSPVQDDSTSSVLGTKQTPLITSGSCAGQIESGSGYVVQRQCSSKEVEVTPSVGSNDLVGLWQRKKVDLFASEDNYHCPIYFSRQRDALAHD